MDYILHILTIASIFSILALTLNLVVGFTGLLSLAHAAFFGIGAYTTAILTTSFDFNFFLSLLIGTILATVVALLLGLVLSRFRGDYYLLVTLGFTVIVYQIFVNWSSLTHGALGIPAIPRPEIFGNVLVSMKLFFILCFILLVGVYFISKFLEKSSFGRALKAIREDEEALQVFGYHTYFFKLIIFSLSAGLASIAGSLYASYISFIDPSTFTINESILILSIIILGGLGSLRGSVLGAFLLVFLPEFLRFVGFPDSISAYLREFVYGAILVILMMYHPKGIWGQYKL